MAIDVEKLTQIEKEFKTVSSDVPVSEADKEIVELIEYYLNGEDFKNTGSVRIWPTILCKYLYKDLWDETLPKDATDEQKKNLKNRKAAKKQKVKAKLKDYCKKNGYEYNPSPTKQGPVEGFVDVNKKKKK